MIRRSQRKEVDRHRSRQYQRVAEGLVESAEALYALSDEGDRYGNAIGVLAVHAAIAWADALTIAYGGVKHTGSEHARAADLLLEVLGERRVPSSARKTLQAILQTKQEVAYQGEFYRIDDAMTLLTQLRGFVQWAEERYERRPA